jgi:type I restriction enzyme S subunit
MAGEWPITTFAKAPIEIIDGDRGKNYPSQSEFHDTGHCLFLNAGNVTESGFDFSSCAFISEEKDRLLRKGKLARHDVVLTTRGTVGNSAYFDDSVPYEILRINSGMVILRAKQRDLHPRYLYMFIRSKLLHEQVSALRTGSAQPQLPIRDIQRIEIPIPPLPEQRAIAHILGTLDDKIELNRRMNRTLEEIARAIFKSWFIDFDPVIDNALDAGKPIPEELTERAACRERLTHGKSPLPENIRRLFPDEFQDSELGPIPKGWELSTIGEEFNVTMGQSPPGRTYNETGNGLPFFQGRRDFGFRYPTKRVYCSEPKRIAEAGDALVTVRAPVGDVNMAPEELCLGRGLAGVHHNSGSQSYTYYAMLSLQERFQEYESEGTVFGAINKVQFSGLEWVHPGVSLVEAFENSLSAVDEMIRLNELEASQLASARDALLPRLLSGELEPMSRGRLP